MQKEGDGTITGLIRIVDDMVQWNKMLKGFKGADVYYSYEYGKLFAKIEKGTLHAAYFENGSAKIFYPFIKRKIDWEGEPLFDIVTPYGYGGPILEGSGETLVSFYKSFEEYCHENGIITETIRFHPIHKNHKLCTNVMAVEYIRKTAAVDLTVPINNIRKNYSSMNKRNIKKAKGLGLFCYTAEMNMENIHIFKGLYQETMDRNHADSYYYFDETYFIEQIKETDISSTHLLFVEHDAEIIAGIIVLIGPSFAHYHLGASKTKYLPLKPNNLLFDYMIEFCQSKGLVLLHLGGGYQENDGLFRFKASYSNGLYFDYFIGKKVYDQNHYKAIIEAVKKRGKINEGYFPIYRGKKEILVNAYLDIKGEE